MHPLKLEDRAKRPSAGERGQRMPPSRIFLEGAQDSSASDVECRHIPDLLPDYLDGMLPETPRKTIDGHIERCAPCRAFVNTYRATMKATWSLRDTPSRPK
jgi:hypothetical protein